LVIRRFLSAFMRPFLAVFIGKVFHPSPSPCPSPRRCTLGERARARASRSPVRAPLPVLPVASSRLLLYGCTRLAVFDCARYLALSLNIPRFIYGCSSRFIAVRAALFALTCFNVECSFLSRARPDRLMLFPSSPSWLPPPPSSSFPLPPYVHRIFTVPTVRYTRASRACNERYSARTLALEGYRINKEAFDVRRRGARLILLSKMQTDVTENSFTFFL